MPTISPTCHHLHPTGRPCGSPALRGEQFCFYHHPTRRPPSRTAVRTAFDVPPITDAENLQFTLSEVIRRLAANTLDTRRASLLLTTLQLAKANLAAMPGYESPRSAGPRASGKAPGAPDFPDLSGLLSALSPRPTPTAAKP